MIESTQPSTLPPDITLESINAALEALDKADEGAEVFDVFITCKKHKAGIEKYYREKNIPEIARATIHVIPYLKKIRILTKSQYARFNVGRSTISGLT